MELFFNIIHYCIYKADCKRHLLSNKINPFVLLGRIPEVKKKFEEQGTSLLGVTNKIWGDNRYGFSIMISGSVIVICLTFLIWGIVSSISSLFDLYFYIKPLHVVLYAFNSYLTCHLTVFKGDKYSSDQIVSLLIEIKGLSEKNDKAFLIPPPVPRISGSLKILIS